MAHFIDPAKCVNCKACAAACPTDCISEKDGKHWIDPDVCIDCGACAAECPSDAISAP
ncbi:MAG: 4Fe-4S binding protein [Treponema sp.]|nr:4Fe-4S binding protein [Treponema sp.]